LAIIKIFYVFFKKGTQKYRHAPLQPNDYHNDFGTNSRFNCKSSCYIRRVAYIKTYKTFEKLLDKLTY